MSYTALKTRRNSKLKSKPLFGLWFERATNTYSVWVEKGRYDGKVRGGIRYSWAYVVKGVTLEEAVKVFNKRVNWKKSLDIKIAV